MRIYDVVGYSILPSGVGSISVSGNHESLFTVGVTFTVVDGTATIASSSVGAASIFDPEMNDTTWTINTPFTFDPVGMQITNVSSYEFTVQNVDGGTDVHIVGSKESVEFGGNEVLGRNTHSWGETFQQNALNQQSTYAGSSAPENPLYGQLWYQMVEGQGPGGILMAFNGHVWRPANEHLFAHSYVHHQESSSITWHVDHQLHTRDITLQVWEDGEVSSMVFPSSVSVVNEDQLTVTFTTPRAGRVVVLGAIQPWVIEG